MSVKTIANLVRVATAGAALWIALLARPTVSHALHFDYLVEQNINGQLVTGTNDFDNGNALVLRAAGAGLLSRSGRQLFRVRSRL